jgi:hypothetical protein
LAGGRTTAAAMTPRAEKAFGAFMGTLWCMQAWYASDTMRQRASEVDDVSEILTWVRHLFRRSMRP